MFGVPIIAAEPTFAPSRCLVLLLLAAPLPPPGEGRTLLFPPCRRLELYGASFACPGTAGDFRERTIQQHGKNATLTSENRRSRRRRWRSRLLAGLIGGARAAAPAARRCGTTVCRQYRRDFAARVRCLQECSGTRRGSSKTRDKRARNRYCMNQELRHSHIQFRRKVAMTNFA